MATSLRVKTLKNSCRLIMTAWPRRLLRISKLMPLWATKFEEFVRNEEAMTETGIPHKLIGPFYARVIRIIHRWPLDQTEVLLIKAREQYFIWKRDPVRYERKKCSGIAKK